MKKYPSKPHCYHAALNALIQDPYTQDARDKLAKLIRYYRTFEGREQTRAIVNHAAFIGWPIKRRPCRRWS